MLVELLCCLFKVVLNTIHLFDFEDIIQSNWLHIWFSHNESENFYSVRRTCLIHCGWIVKFYQKLWNFYQQVLKTNAEEKYRILICFRPKLEYMIGFCWFFWLRRQFTLGRFSAKMTIVHWGTLTVCTCRWNFRYIRNSAWFLEFRFFYRLSPWLSTYILELGMYFFVSNSSCIVHVFGAFSIDSFLEIWWYLMRKLLENS